jgi:8-oxo-dGTP pyrophosphatase MutT (NUDIX family)
MKNQHANEENHLKRVRRLAASLPKFPDGRINYTTSDVAPVVNCMVYHNEQVLLLRRSNRVGADQGKWSGVDGYIDTLDPLRSTVLKELKEELRLPEEGVADIQIARPYRSADPKAKKTWIVYPVLVELTKAPNITLDWEHTRYEWVRPDKINRFDLLPGQERVLKKALALREAPR